MNQSIKVSDLSFSYADQALFSRVNFVVEPGVVFKVCGQNGSGKSTVLKTLAGLLEPQSGQIQYPSQDGFANLVGYLGHRNSLDPALNAIEHFLVDVLIKQPLAKEAIFKLLARWGLNQRVVTNQVQNYSAGQKKRLALLC